MRKFLQEFEKFAMRGNMVDLAVGFTVGAAFSTIARSFVDDVIMPVVGLIIGRVEFKDMFLLLREGPETAAPYITLADAQEAGAVTLNYGLFINNIITFVIVALAMFFVVRAINHLEDAIEDELDLEEEASDKPANKKCPYCLSMIPRRATRCPQCTSRLEKEPTAVSAPSS